MQTSGIFSGMPLEVHYDLGSNPTYDDWVAVMKNYTELVDEVAISELDVAVLTPVTPQNASIYDLQAESFYNATAACLTFDKCVGVTIWDGRTNIHRYLLFFQTWETHHRGTRISRRNRLIMVLCARSRRSGLIKR